MNACINKFIIIFFFFLGSPYLLLSQECIWSSVAGGNDNDIGRVIAADKEGNIFVAGFTRSGFCYFNTDTIITEGINDLFIVKYDVSGHEVWIKQLGWENTNEDDYEAIGGIITDTIHERLLVSGTFYTHLNLPDTTLNGWGQTVFVLSMDYNGNVIWARAGVSVQHEFGENHAFDITCDEEGNVYISGCNKLLASFNGIEVPPGGFLAKYDLNGNILWAKNKFRYWSQWPPNSTYPYTEAPPFHIHYYNNHLLINGNVYNETIIIDTITIINSPGYFASYVASFSSEGDIIWIRLAGGPAANCGTRFSVDNSGGIYITGVFGEIGIFGNDTLISPTSSGNCFFSKFQSDGTFSWAKSVNSSDFAVGQGVVSDIDNNVYFSGTFSGTAQFGQTTLISESNSDMFLTQFTNDGICNGVRQYSNGSLPGITTDANGNICMTGAFRVYLDIGSQSYTTRGKADLFVAKCSAITGLEEPQKTEQNTLLIYANPNTGKCNITIPDEFKKEKNLRLQIYDNKGRLIQQTAVEIAEDKIKLDIEAQAKGMYTAILSNGKKNYSGKIVFE